MQYQRGLPDSDSENLGSNPSSPAIPTPLGEMVETLPGLAPGAPTDAKRQPGLRAAGRMLRQVQCLCSM